MTRDRRAGLARLLAPVGLAAAVVLAVAGAAAAESPGPGSSAAPAASGGAAISIIGTTFQPADVTIHVGDTVTWTVTQTVGAAHSVTSGNPSDANPGTVFDSGVSLRNNGNTYSHTFATAGTFPFFCTVHPTTMRGTVIVQAGAGGGSDTTTDTAPKVIAAAVLAVALVILFGWARLYRRMNPAP